MIQKDNWSIKNKHIYNIDILEIYFGMDGLFQFVCCLHILTIYNVFFVPTIDW